MSMKKIMHLYQVEMYCIKEPREEKMAVCAESVEHAISRIREDNYTKEYWIITSVEYLSEISIY